MAFKMKSPLKRQDLSVEARDLAYAKTADRKAKKAENQVLRRSAKKKGINISGKDYDHKDGKFKSVKANRGNDGIGTKNE